MDALQPKLLALLPPQIAHQQTNRDLTLTNYATTSGINDQAAAALQNSTALGQAYDAAKNDDSFYLPPEAFTNPEFQRGLKMFLSPDGKAARMIITHDGDPATPARHLAYRRDQRLRGGKPSKAHPWPGPTSTYPVPPRLIRTSRRAPNTTS